MNAYYLAMLYVSICAGIFLMGNLGVFGPVVENTVTGRIVSFFSENDLESNVFLPVTIAGGIVAMALVMYANSIQVFGSKSGSPQGVAYLVFAGVFWTAFLLAFDVMRTVASLFNGMALFNMIFAGLSVLVFVMALVQLATSGVKSHG